MGASVLLALLTGVRIQSYATQASRAAASGSRHVPVLVASRTIERGQPLSANLLRQSSVPAAYAPPGAMASIAQAAGRVALTDLAPGEVVTDTRLARVRAGPVASLVPQGLRAFAVPTTLPPSVVVAGDRVDVLATYGAGSGQPHTETVVQGVEVLLVLGGAQTGDHKGGLALDLSASDINEPAVLIVLVAPEQEEQLAFARAFADLEVALVPAVEQVQVVQPEPEATVPAA
jgi:Flp pilus assembly protein CpaB